MRRSGITLFGLGCVVALLPQCSFGAPLFSQYFQSSSSVASYVSATPNNGQFNAIGTSNANTVVSITSGQLTYDRNTTATSVGTFSRTTDFSPTPLSLNYQFDLTV